MALRIAVIFILLPVMLAWYWLGLLIDEVIFRGYRSVKIKAPVFIIGVPRSGTTALHETLAKDAQFTTMRAWECLLAPAVSHRFLLRGLVRTDRKLGAPLMRFARWIHRRAIEPLTGAHPLKARAPEEDYLTLLPHLSAFILIVVFPRWERLWRIGSGDALLSRAEQQRLMRRYRRAIQRHLYFHGPAAGRYLAKNASFATLAGCLSDAFPDARLIACLREPEAVVSSQLSSLLPALELLHGQRQTAYLQERMLNQLHRAYRSLLDTLAQSAPDRAIYLPLNAQRQNLSASLKTAYQHLDLPLSPEFQDYLEQAEQRARTHRSNHKHTLAGQGLNESTIQSQFGDIADDFDFAQQHPQPVAERNPPQMPLRVALICDSPPERNGVGAYYSDIAAYLTGRVTHVSLISPGAEAHPMPIWLSLALPGDDTQKLKLPSPFAFWRYLHSLNPHAVVISAPGPFGILAAWAGKRLGAKVIFGLHTDYEALAEMYWGPVLRRVNRFFMARINRFIIRRSDVVVSNSAQMQQLAASLQAKAVATVGTPVPHRFLDTIPKPPTTPPQKVLFIGRLSAEKNIEAVLEAARQLPDLQFTIAGDGPLRDTVQAAATAQANVHYLGWMERSALIPTLDAADILVLPSEVEAFGTVALEALSRARITLVSAGCGIADWPEFKDALWVMAPQQSVTTALQEILKTPADTLGIRAEQGREAAKQMTQRCIDEWVELLNGAPRT
ncbi:glycosyltransferase [Spiribacter sp. C176]|uniref:Glycosyltransferase n=1 Tax=Spiribacter salilacus TaxID=2664894 RepID=A0A6N7QQ93_9GAMM|nr:glycosyltransferase [Spiribacter salilacus]MRH77870.1 glycosyltransferase [Spiribacter salilacus]